MKNILLVDVDSKIPNLALMKLSTYHKQKGDMVKLIRFNISYYPNRRNKKHIIPIGYDKTYCSVIFNGAIDYIKCHNHVEFGGSGFSLSITLPAYIEELEPDYSIYPENNVSYGFISRGCIRKCSFCLVPEKEGAIKQVRNIDEIIRHKKVKFLDNNFLALGNHKEILNMLIKRGIRCEFNQGLDIRLIDQENSDLLSRLNYMQPYTFAFDDWSYLKWIETSLLLLPWRKIWQFRFFVYCHPDMEIDNIVNRVKYLRTQQILPYIMRHSDCWGSVNSDFYVDIASWCNQPGLIKSLEFSEFMKRRYPVNNHRSRNRIRNSVDLF